MKYEIISTEQIKKIYDNPELLKTLFPNAFLEAGKWYLRTFMGDTGLFNFSGRCDENNNPLGYGINICEDWVYLNEVGWLYDEIRPATPEEVGIALMTEAKKRGYEYGVKIRGISTNFSFVIHDDYFKFYKDTNVLTLGDNLIFENGEWAEIIKETEIELTLDEIAEKFGVDKVKIKK